MEELTSLGYELPSGVEAWLSWTGQSEKIIESLKIYNAGWLVIFLDGCRNILNSQPNNLPSRTNIHLSNLERIYQLNRDLKDEFTLIERYEGIAKILFFQMETLRLLRCGVRSFYFSVSMGEQIGTFPLEKIKKALQADETSPVEEIQRFLFLSKFLRGGYIISFLGQIFYIHERDDNIFLTPLINNLFEFYLPEEAIPYLIKCELDSRGKLYGHFGQPIVGFYYKGERIKLSDLDHIREIRGHKFKIENR